jgi:hypothetical protein
MGFCRRGHGLLAARISPTSAVIVDESQRPEFVREKADPRPGCADDLSEGLLTDLRDYALVLTFL